ncbi:MAG: LysR family transcriptional regulator [Spirochaetales bacterium]
MDIDFELYKIFVSVATCGSMNKASQELHVTQSAISQSLKKLEGLLDVKLFERTRRGLVLTLKGKELLDEVNKPISALTLAEGKLKRKITHKKVLTIACSQILARQYFAPYVKNFANYNIRVLNHLSNKETILAVENNECDFAILKDYNQPKSDTLECQIIGNLHYVFFTFGNLINAENCYNYPVVIKDFGSKLRYLNIQELESQFKKFSNKIQLGHDELIVDFVSEMDCVGFAPKEYLTRDFKILNISGAYNIPVQCIYKNKNDDAKLFLGAINGKKCQ